MSQHEYIAIALLALAGFLIGGVYTMWKQASRVAAAVLGVLALLAAGGAVAWFMSN
jgi:hypothetical protein